MRAKRNAITNAPCPFDQPGQSAEKPAFIQCLFVEEFEVDYDLQVYQKSSDYPTPSNKITVKGRPAAQGSEVLRAELYFYDDNRSNAKPFYNRETKCITAYYKMSLFDQIRNLLHINSEAMHLHYYEYHPEDPNSCVIHVQFYEYGKL
jgi:hypothetical protein